MVHLAGPEEGTWHLDLKNAPGASKSGEPAVPTDVTFTLKEADFHKLFAGIVHSGRRFDKTR